MARSRKSRRGKKRSPIKGGIRIRRSRRGGMLRAAVAGVKRLTSMIETKESTRRTAANLDCAHNNVTLVTDTQTGQRLNPFYLQQDVSDTMSAPGGGRIGDRVTVKGLMIRAFLENALGRAKVYFRIMLIRGAKGDTVSRATLFKSDSDNKMIDQVNTERFSIIKQRIFTVRNDTLSTTGVSAAGIPNNGFGTGQPTKIIKLWIPGRKFGKGGNIQYENNSSSQVKFFDYTIAIVCYDWYGTPQDVNNVGKINEMYCKLYFKDA